MINDCFFLDNVRDKLFEIIHNLRLQIPTYFPLYCLMLFYCYSKPFSYKKTDLKSHNKTLYIE